MTTTEYARRAAEKYLTAYGEWFLSGDNPASPNMYFWSGRIGRALYALDRNDVLKSTDHHTPEWWGYAYRRAALTIHATV